MNESCVEATIGASASPKKESDSVEDNNAESSPGRSSPEANCPICLGKPENKSFTDSCLHQFCFTCLLEWSKVKAECPLCKQSFKSIIHNVRSIEDYEQYYLSTTAAEGTIMGIIHYEANQNREPFRYRTTAVSSYLNYFVRLEEAISHHVIPPGPSPISAATYWQRRRQRGTSDFRRNIYQQGLWVQRTSDVTGRVRECSPEFYRANPAQIHRLVPWLNRELNVLLYENSPHIQHVTSRILDLIVQVPIRSPGFAAAVAPYFGRHTEHFIHEFHSFATSPFDLVGYDRHANYVLRNMLAHNVLPSEEGSDSDVQVLEEARTTSPLHSIQLDDSDSDDCVVLDSQPRSQPEVITLDSDDEDLEVVQIDLHTSEQPTASTSQAKSSSSYRPRLKRNWFKLDELQVPTTSSDENFDVSINIQSASPTRSETSSSSWTPDNKHPKKSKKKEKSKKKKSLKIKTSKSKLRCNLTESESGNEKLHRPTSRKRKVIESDSEDENKTPSVSLHQSQKSIKNDSEDEKSVRRVSRQRKPAVKYESSSDSDNDNLFIDTSSSTSCDEYKPRIRSVVVKSEPRAKSPAFTHSSFRSDNIDHVASNSSSFLDVPSCSNNRTDSYRSSYDDHSCTYSTSSLDKLPYKKRKHYKRKSKRDKI